MNPSPHRRLLAEAATAVLVAAAAQYFVAQPALRALALTESQVTSTSAALAQGANSLDALAIEQLMHDLRATSDWVELQNSTATNPAQLLETLARIADASGVRIENVRPMETIVMASPTPPPQPADAPIAADAPMPPSWRDSRTTCGLTVTGRYESLVRFTRALTDDLGFVAISGLQISPVSLPGSDAVQAELQIRQFQFDTGSIRSAMSLATTAAPAPGAPE